MQEPEIYSLREQLWALCALETPLLQTGDSQS